MIWFRCYDYMLPAGSLSDCALLRTSCQEVVLQMVQRLNIRYVGRSLNVTILVWSSFYFFQPEATGRRFGGITWILRRVFSGTEKRCDNKVSGVQYFT